MITDDPIAWVGPIIKTRTRLISFSLFHIAVICYGLWRVWIYTSLVVYDCDIDFLFYRFFFAGLIPLVIFGVFFPILYLYALYRIYHKFIVDNTDS
jgi:hypothetical protein